MGEHRVSMLGLSLRRNGDPTTSRDPRVQAVVRALKDADYAPAPRAEFRDELRAQLVAVTSRVVAEGDPATSPATAAPGPAKHRRHREARSRRPIAVAASVIALLALILGGVTWLSQKALPGDALYGLKRASENVRLDFTSGDTNKGVAYLKLHTRRVQEAQDLLGRNSALGSGENADGPSVHTQALIRSNLNSANTDLRDGIGLLRSRMSASTNALVTTWAWKEQGLVAHLTDSLPVGSAKQQAATSRGQVLSTWREFGGRLTSNGTPTTIPPRSIHPGGGTDTPNATTGPTPTTVSTSAPLGSSGGTVGKSAARPSTAPKTGSSRTPNAAPSPSLSVSSAPSTPKVPEILTSPPVSVGSCGVNVSLGPIGAGVSVCPTP